MPELISVLFLKMRESDVSVELTNSGREDDAFGLETKVIHVSRMNHNKKVVMLMARFPFAATE
jgi:hypothetical protein